MEKHQEEYIKLLSERFDIVGKPKRASYKRMGDTWNSGIIIELKTYTCDPRLVFLSDTQENYFHRWESQLGRSNLPRCVWITGYTDRDLYVYRGLHI